MKLILAILSLGLLSSTLAFTSVKSLPSTAIDTSYLTKATSASRKRPSFAQLSTLMQQLRDTTEVTEQLEELLEEIDENRLPKLAIHEQTVEQCTEEVAFREVEIQAGQSSAEAAQNQLNIAVGQYNLAVALAEKASNYIPQWQDTLANTESAREARHRENQRKRGLLVELLEHIATLKELLVEYETTGQDTSTFLPSLIQTTNKLLKTAVHTSNSQHVLPVYTKLLQTHAKQQVNTAAVEEINSLLDLVVERAQNGIQALDATDEQDENDTQAQVDHINDVLNTLNSQLVVASGFAATQQRSINQEESVLSLSNDKVTRNTDLLQAAEDHCQRSQEQWDQSEVARARERNLINALLQAVQALEAQFEAEEGPQVGNLVNLVM